MDLSSLLAPGGANTLTATENAQIELRLIIRAEPIPGLGGVPLPEVDSIASTPEIVPTGETLTQTTREIDQAVNELAGHTREVVLNLQDCVWSSSVSPYSSMVQGGRDGLIASFGGAEFARRLLHGIQSLQNLIDGTPNGKPTPIASANSSTNMAEPWDGTVDTSQMTR